MRITTKFKTKKLFRILAVFTMGSIFLPIIFQNVPFPFSTTYFYCLFWLFFCFCLYPKILFSRKMLYPLLFALIFFVGVYVVWSGVYSIEHRSLLESVMREVFPVFFPILIYTYFTLKQDYRGLAIVISFTLLFIFITCVTSIIGLYQYPMAARELTSMNFRINSPDLKEYYTSIGIANYFFFTPLSFTVPVIIYLLKDFYRHNLNKQLIFGLLLFVFISAIVMSKFTMSLVISFALIPVSFLKMRSNKIFLIAAVLVFVIILITPAQYFSGALQSVSGLFEGSITERRLKDFALFIENPVIDPYQKGKTHVGVKLGRIPLLIESFRQNPLWGSGYALGHNFWFDRLSMFGIIGIIPWILIIHYQIKQNLKMFKQDFKPYYMLSMIAFLLVGFFNTMYAFMVFTIVFFVIPGIYYLRFLGKQSPQKHSLNKRMVKIYVDNRLQI